MVFCMIIGMERSLRAIVQLATLVAAVAMLLVAAMAVCYTVGVCAGMVHLGYEWAVS